MILAKFIRTEMIMTNDSTYRFNLSWPKILLGLFLVVLAAASSGCTSYSDSHERIKLREIKLAPLAKMPDYVQIASPEIQEAYRFAAANPKILEQIPCYCGCNSLGHTSNLECYIGEAGFDNHAAYCTVCVDITRDTMRLTRENKTVEQIRRYIVDKYSKYGPSTDTVAATKDSMPSPMGPMLPNTLTDTRSSKGNEE
jgi:hypothetical protein